MDMIYMSDAMAYQSIRGPIYDRYEQQWQQQLRQKREQERQQKLQNLHTGQKGRNSGSGEKESCKICQERQRRSLLTYIRSKSHDESHAACIIEEEEDEQSQRDVEGAGKTAP